MLKDKEYYKNIVKKLENVLVKYKKEIEEDLSIDEHNIAQKSLIRTRIAVKWNERYVKLLKLEEELNLVLNSVYMELYKLYRFEDEIEYTGRDLERKIKSDKEYMEFEEHIAYVKSVKEFVKNNLKLIEQQVYDIKNYVEYLKLVNYGGG